jgi:hypothetical protein
VDVVCDIAAGVELALTLPFYVLAPLHFYSGQPPPQSPSSRAPEPVPQEVSYRNAWQPDTESSSCNACGTKFTLWLRRHHCRLCGKLFCNACTTKRAPITALKYHIPVRVCETCFVQAGKSKKRDVVVLVQPSPAAAAAPTQADVAMEEDP